MQVESTLPTVFRKKLPPKLEKIKYGQYTKDDLDYPIHKYLKENDIRVDEEGSEVIAFLRGKSILVTGATGFLGKLLVEKLLRCCKDIGTIYIIVRTKKGKDTDSRLKEYLGNWVFVKLSEIYPEFGKKIVAVSGDFEEDGLGLSEESRKMLREKVNIIYHLAATVRFDEKLKKATKINVEGTLEIMKLAKECKRLDVLAYMSTAYSNSTSKEIKEELYTPFIDPQSLIDITNISSDEVVDRITPGLLNDSPNTYAFTKQIAEDVIRRESAGFPACIQRPSIVIPSVREPVRSWVDNIYGPVGIVLSVAMGISHVMWGNGNGRSDMVPADYVVNNLIVASYKTAKHRSTNTVEVFNFCASWDNPIYWNNLRLSKRQGTKIGSAKVLTIPFFVYTKCWYWYRTINFILHTVPGRIFDFVLVKRGKEPLLGRAYEKINRFVIALSYFTLHEWNFVTTNTTDLWETLNEKDKSIFPFDMQTLNWPDYFDTFLVAMRELLLFETLDNLDEGRAHSKRAHVIFFTTLAIILLLSSYVCWNTILCIVPILIVISTIYFVSAELCLS